MLMKTNSESWGFSIVGGYEESHGQQPFFIKTIVPGTPAHFDGRLKWVSRPPFNNICTFLFLFCCFWKKLILIFSKDVLSFSIYQTILNKCIMVFTKKYEAAQLISINYIWKYNQKSIFFIVIILAILLFLLYCWINKLFQKTYRPKLLKGSVDSIIFFGIF